MWLEFSGTLLQAICEAASHTTMLFPAHRDKMGQEGSSQASRTHGPGRELLIRGSSWGWAEKNPSEDEVQQHSSLTKRSSLRTLFMNLQQPGRAFRETGRKGPGAHKAPAQLPRSPAATEGADRSQGKENRAEPGLQRTGGGAGGREGAGRARRRAGGPGRTRPHQRSRA